MLIVFLNYPAFKKKRLGFDFLSTQTKIPFPDIVIAVIATVSALYIALDYEGMATRHGAPVLRDLVVGLALVFLLLEATRRVIGPALPIIASLFVGYAFLGQHMPDVIAFKGVSLDRFVGQMTMSTQGIYGIPLDVSATIVFLFVLFGAMLEKAGAGRYFIKLALSILGRLQRRSGQGRYYGQRPYRDGFRIKHRKHCHNRNVYHPHDEKSRLSCYQSRCC